ncbi:TetR/AcrR family transcriptional regulator [Stenotrophomonas maltophilia]|uniref:TetR/AcrR family transcriptional regulator n=1 Tax=Stenotrophomonas maltophilia TaxID=40324 RepID=A0ABD7C930_STEMA|nr:TetR/AcrR family transcriptional regulator [Stenotrophomonas maltophilia]QQQ44414.1 TetR/AcrR family transcriptional regulator [Stenotrophomonas maltophilia]
MNYAEMGKTRTIDRDHVLDMAEQIVGEQGAAALSIDALAKAAGISKGGVQSCFGNRHGLIQAMLDRWAVQYDQRLQAMAGTAANTLTAEELIRHHVAITDDEHELNTRAACQIIALMDERQFTSWLRSWHDKRLLALDVRTPEGKRMRLAYLATEGAFVLRYFGLSSLNDNDWASIFSEIADLSENGSMIRSGR